MAEPDSGLRPGENPETPFDTQNPAPDPREMAHENSTAGPLLSCAICPVSTKTVTQLSSGIMGAGDSAAGSEVLIL